MTCMNNTIHAQASIELAPFNSFHFEFHNIDLA